MDIETAIQERKNLEAAILTLLKDFQEQTGLLPTHVEIDHTKSTSILGQSRLWIVGVTVDVKL
jgi:NADH:ubiquinone oxidoreductase subunit E